MYPESSGPTLKTQQLVTVFKSGVIFYNDKLACASRVKEEDKWITAACINQKTVTHGGQNVNILRKDIETGLLKWEAEKSKEWWKKTAYPTALSMIPDKRNQDDHFFVSTNQGYVRQYDVRASTKGKPVLELQLNNTLNHPDLHHEESFNRIQQIGNTSQLICSGNRGSLCVLDTRKFLTFQEYTKYAPEARPDKKPVVKMYAMLDYRHNNLITHDFINPTKTRPGLLATTGSDGNLRLYDARTEVTKDIMYLKNQINFFQFVPGITIFNPEKEHERLVKTGDVLPLSTTSGAGSKRKEPSEGGSDEKAAPTPKSSTTNKESYTDKFKTVKEYEKAEMAKIAAKKKKLPPKNINFRPNANRNRHQMKLSDMFDHGHESGGRRPEGYNYDTGHDKGYNEEYIS